MTGQRSVKGTFRLPISVLPSGNERPTALSQQREAVIMEHFCFVFWEPRKLEFVFPTLIQFSWNLRRKSPFVRDSASSVTSAQWGRIQLRVLVSCFGVITGRCFETSAPGRSCGDEY